MSIDKTMLNTKEVILLFAEAIKNKDFKIISSLLSSKGVFEMQLLNFDSVKKKKKEFFKWFSEKLKVTEITSINFDHCIGCKYGNHVMLINEGQFPRVVADSSERSKTGLMIEVKRGAIWCIKFCCEFKKTENKYVFECKAELMRSLIDKGYTIDEALDEVLGKKA